MTDVGLNLHHISCRQPDPDDQDLPDVHERLRPVQERVFLATGLESRARRC